MSNPFRPERIDSFRFTRWHFDATTGRVELSYALDDHYHFTEVITLPMPAHPLAPAQQAALNACLRLLHLVAGISYYKTAVPAQIDVESTVLSHPNAQFLQTLYLSGLGEFAHENKLVIQDKLQFPHNATQQDTPVRLQPKQQALVAVGGGKDSIVSLEALKAAGLPVTLFAVGNAAPIQQTIERAGLPALQVHRQLDPLLFELNRQGAYNGHVPITAIVSLLATATAILHQHQAIIFSNERSASQGNLIYDNGFEVNHQFSKSLAFEEQLAHTINTTVSPDLDYFSLLRPFSELDIARAFTQAHDYFEVFSSCNKNFRQHKATEQNRWCGNCPKCRFVYLILAAFLPKSDITRIFGKDLLDDPQQTAGFDALLGIDAHKPFECVGEEAESHSAFVLLTRRSEWLDSQLVARYREKILPRLDNPDRLIKDYLTPIAMADIPSPYRQAIEAYFASAPRLQR